MLDANAGGRPNQKMRTRKDLIQAAARLMKEGRKPTLEEVSAEALVSRATAYRYFPSVEALLAEASLDVVTPEPDELFRNATQDPASRLEAVDTLFHEIMRDNEAAFRIMLAHAVERGIGSGEADGLPRRQNRRTPLIAAALEPARDQFEPAALKVLTRALALIVGTEGMVVCTDVLRLKDSEARQVKRWAIRALVEAARKTGKKPGRRN
jgi:AcrR family transcriptional regulator